MWVYVVFVTAVYVSQHVYSEYGSSRMAFTLQLHGKNNICVPPELNKKISNILWKTEPDWIWNHLSIHVICSGDIGIFVDAALSFKMFSKLGLFTASSAPVLLFRMRVPMTKTHFSYCTDRIRGSGTCVTQHFSTYDFIFYGNSMLVSSTLRQGDHYKILHMPRQLCCRGMCKIL